MSTGREFCGPLLVDDLQGIEDEVGIGDLDLHNVAYSIVESMRVAWTPKGALGDHELAEISRHMRRRSHDDQMDSCSFLCE